MSSVPDTNADSSRSPQRLTLEEKVWFDRRRNDIKYCSSVGAALGAAVATAVITFGPFPRRVQFFAIAGGVVIGGGAGFLYADSMALQRVKDLSASSNLRKQYQQMYDAVASIPVRLWSGLKPSQFIICAAFLSGACSEMEKKATKTFK